MGRFGPLDPDLLRLERWRTRLIAEGFDAIDDFIAEYPAADACVLKREIQRAQAMNRRGTARPLLRYLRELDRSRAAADGTQDQARVPPTVS